MRRAPTPSSNPLRNRPSISATTALPRKSTPLPTPRPAKRICPNKGCMNPHIEDGTCTSCGYVVDDSNIVAEVQFGENSSGAAVVQGSFVAADAGGVRSMGPMFNRVGSDDGREATVREGKRLMQSMGAQMPIPIQTQIIDSGLQIFKIAAMNNFIQGRRMDMVAAVCLYSACRKERPCKVMLIDFADKCQVNVFKLGHTFKSLHATITISKDGIQPVLPEDLIYRFALKLEFGSMLDKVADDACRMLNHMKYDWMVMGRRPSGVCGACLILAARMNNFRRTITEVVYVVKVTTHTIQKRLDEFKLTPTGNLTIEEFLNHEWNSQAAHDPPSFYEKTEEFQKTIKRRKKRKHDGPIEGEDDGEEAETEASVASPNKRQKTTNPTPEPVEELRRDADGFAIPPRPPQTAPVSAPIPQLPIDPDLMNEEQEEEHLTELAGDFGIDPELQDTPADPTPEAAPSSPKRKKGPDNRPIKVSEGWLADEATLEAEISEMISDPNTEHHAASYAKAAERAAAHMLVAESTNPQKDINMDVNIGLDEFDDDEEVSNCLLAPEQVAIKEKIWVNKNRDWLRKQQLKEYQRLIAEQGPPKATRNRKKKPRIGEGQTSAAESPSAAAIEMMKARTLSKKIDYSALGGLFSDGGSNTLGSGATSRVTSRAGSVLSDTGTEASDDSRSILKDPKGRVRGSSRTPAPATTSTYSPPVIDIDSEPDSDDDDYVGGSNSAGATPKPVVPEVVEEEREDWLGHIKNAHKSGDQADDTVLDEDDDYADDYENGDVDLGFTAGGSDGGFGGDDDDEYY